MITALIILHEGFEEIEAVTTFDLLTRAGITCTFASREAGLQIKGHCGLVVQAERLIEDFHEKLFDVLVIPGGQGTPRMLGDDRIRALLTHHNANDKLIAAICAAPIILDEAHLLEGKHFTSHPCVWSKLPMADKQQSVVIDGNLITANGPGAAIPFAQAIITKVLGKDKSEAIGQEIGLNGF